MTRFKWVIIIWVVWIWAKLIPSQSLEPVIVLLLIWKELNIPQSFHAMAVLGYLPKLKRGSGLIFSAHKNVPYFYSVNWSFNVIPFSLSRYQTKHAIEFLFRELMTEKILRLIFDRPNVMADREKTGKIKIQKCEYHENKKNFSHEIN